MSDNVFTTKEILLQLADTVDDRFDAIDAKFNRLEDRLEEDLKDHEFRIRKVEKIAWSRWTRPVAVGSAVVSTIAAVTLAVLQQFVGG